MIQHELENPVGNTGLNIQKDFRLEPRIDWLDGVSRVSTQQEIDRLENFLTSPDFDPVISRLHGIFHRGCNYHHQLRSFHGVEILYSLPSDLEGISNEGRVRVSIPGKKLAILGFVDSWRMCIGLQHAYKMKVTRMDCTVDVYGEDKNLDKLLLKVARAGKRGDFRGVDSYHAIIPRIRTATGMEKTGETHYFGSASSDKRLCIYDKRLESNHKIESVRFEARLRGDVANQAFQAFASLKFEFADYEKSEDERFSLHKKLIASVCFGIVDFVDRYTGKDSRRRACRSERLQWYQELLDYSGDRMVLVKQNLPLELTKIFAWLNISVIPSLATVCGSVGHRSFYNWLKEGLVQGRKRMNPRQLALMKISQNCPENFALAS